MTRLPSAVQPVFARRPILDRNVRTVGFQLLLPEEADVRDAWQKILPAAQPMYVTVTAEYLVDCGPPPFHSAGLVLVQARDAAVDDPLLSVLPAIRERGFEIVLEGPSDRPGLESLLELVDLVRLDVLALGEREALGELERLKRRGVAVLAAELHTEDAFTRFRDAGSDLFQGRFYERPGPAGRRPVPVGSMDALSELVDPGSAETEFARLEDVIRRDAGLSYRLLGYANSAFVGLSRPVGSVREALLRLGSRKVRQWALALVLRGLENRPHALLGSALVRARTCELLVGAYDSDHADEAFTVGLFSLLDALLAAPMEDVLRELKLSDEVVAAILRHEGVAGKALEKVIAYERGAFDDPTLAGHVRTVVAISYVDAIRWADGIV